MLELLPILLNAKLNNMIALAILAIAVIWLICKIIPFDHKYIVKQGKHSFAPRRIGLDFRKSWQVHVSFDPSCKYDIGDDQTDINKLFGVSYLSWKSIVFVVKSIAQAIEHKDIKLIKGLHHYNSWRLGWHYSPEIDKVVQHYYCYVKGQRYPARLASIRRMQTGKVTIEKYKRGVFFTCGDLGTPLTIEATFKGLPLKLGGYFGGNRTAPQHIEYYLKIK